MDGWEQRGESEHSSTDFRDTGGMGAGWMAQVSEGGNADTHRKREGGREVSGGLWIEAYHQRVMHLGADAGWCREHEEVQLSAFGFHLLFNHEEAERTDEELMREGEAGGRKQLGSARVLIGLGSISLPFVFPPGAN